MKLIGVATGVYEGNNYAKVIFTEPFNSGRGLGQNAIISKADYHFVQFKLMPQINLFLGSDVIASYDRFGKCNDIRLDVPEEV